MVRVKVCGLTSLEDALVAVTAGADALGFNFWSGSPRYLRPAQAARIIEHLPPFVTAVGVFVDEDLPRLRAAAALAALSAVQLHGDESPEAVRSLAEDGLQVFKALRVGASFQPALLQRYPGVSAFLLDAEVKGERGGTGQTLDWKRARAAGRYGRVVLAGGLTPENVADAIRQARPYGVDVCSGVETQPGRKDHDRLRQFIRRAKGARTE